MPLVKFGEAHIDFPDEMSEEEIASVLQREQKKAESMADLFMPSRRRSSGGNMQRGQRQQREMSTQEWLDAGAVSTLGLPVVGDAAGLAADMHMYATDPSSRHALNYLMTAMGVVPFVPAASTVRRATKGGKKGKTTVYHGADTAFWKDGEVPQFREDVSDGLGPSGSSFATTPEGAAFYGPEVGAFEIEGNIIDVMDIPDEALKSGNVRQYLLERGYGGIYIGETDEIRALSPDVVSVAPDQNIRRQVPTRRSVHSLPRGNWGLVDDETGHVVQTFRSEEAARAALEGSGREKITAYHGSPHDFDKFSMDAIGTGEGAQAYGHGLYFAESEDVAEAYRDQLSGWGNNLSSPKISKEATLSLDEYIETAEDLTQETINRAVADMQQSIDKYGEVGSSMERSSDYKQAWVDELKSASPEDFAFGEGRMYQVEIDASPDELLDWDAPLSEQPEKVKTALGWNFDDMEKWVSENSPNPDLSLKDMLPEIRESWIGSYLKSKGLDHSPNERAFRARVLDGKSDLPEKIAGGDLAKGNEQMLLQSGVKGIKYKDGFSRGAEGGTSNYVIFDDRLITISKKYGIAIPVAAAMLARATGQDAESLYSEMGDDET